MLDSTISPIFPIHSPRSGVDEGDGQMGAGLALNVALLRRSGGARGTSRGQGPPMPTHNKKKHWLKSLVLEA
jgi:hypothetical protein